MKKYVLPFIVFVSAAGILMTGCNLFGTGENSDSGNTAATSEAEVGNVSEKDGVRKEVVYTNSNTGINKETGPMECKIDRVELADIITTTDNASRLLDLEKNTDAVMVTVEFTCKNNWDETANFYVAQASLTTPDGTEYTPKSLYGTYTDACFYAGNTKNGSNVYIIKGKKSMDIDKFSFHIEAPQNWDFKDMSEPLDFDIEIDH